MTQTLFQLLQTLGIPAAYSHFKDGDVPKVPPYIVYIGDGQDTFDADNTHYYRRNRYQIEYYFTKKDETIEAAIEDLLLENGYLYEKSEDTFIEDEGVFVIYYMV